MLLLQLYLGKNLALYNERIFDGAYTDITAQAVARFQEHNGIPVTGIFDAATRGIANIFYDSIPK